MASTIGLNGADYIRILRALKLPKDFLKWVRDGELEDRVTEAYAQYDLLCSMLDAWEADHPEMANEVPWREGREAWKRAGRPRPEWYELLRWHGDSGNFTPLKSRDLSWGLGLYKR